MVLKPLFRKVVQTSGISVPGWSPIAWQHVNLGLLGSSESSAGFSIELIMLWRIPPLQKKDTLVRF